MTVLYVLFALVLIAVAWTIAATFKYGISPMPSSNRVKNSLIDAIPKEMEGKIVELGCGWGTLAFFLASYWPKSQVLAYEISPVPCFYTYLVQLALKYPNLQVHWKDFFLASLEDADVVVCYLYPGAMERLKMKLENELSPGTLVVSNTFSIPEWKAEKVLDIDDLYKTKVFIYKI